MRSAVALLLASCGRIGFDAIDGALDGPPGATTVTIDSAPHHLGDGQGAEGPFFEQGFSLDQPCGLATLLLDSNGSNLEAPPKAFMNGTLVGDFGPFYPPLDTNDPSWQTNPDLSHDWNGGMAPMFDVTATVVVGDNLFRLEDGRPDDDFTFSNVRLVCSP